MDISRFETLLARYAARRSSPEELEALRDLLQTPAADEYSETAMLPLWERLKEQSVDYAVDWEALYASVLAATGETKVVAMHARRHSWIKWVAAACLIGVIAAVGFWLLNDRSETRRDTIAVVSDVEAPDASRAMITLGDGRVVYLDAVGNGQLAEVGGVKLVKMGDGNVEYVGLADNASNEIIYNTLTNPRGSKVVDIRLSDGSHVWLNAGSSITYPVVFGGGQRKVVIKGEGYFEVAHDPVHPFIVSKGDVNVQVLGTHFNVNAYDDEDALLVTLLEGSVKVSNRLNSVMIKPGQQAVLNKDLSFATGSDIDIGEVMAWKNGRFLMNNADIKTVMRELARWYDLEVDYKISIGEKFRVGIDRNTNVSNVFKILEATGAVHFKIEGKKVTVLP